MAENIKQETLSGLKWNIIQKYSIQIIQFLLNIVMARLLTPTDYGTVGMIVIFFAIAQVFINGGMGEALIQKKNATNKDCSTVFWFNLLVSIFCAVVICFTSPLVAKFFNSSVLTDVMRVMSINMVIGAFGAVQTSRLTKNVDFKGIAKITLFASIASGVLGVLLAYMGLGVWALVYQQLLSTLLSTVTLCIYSKWIPKNGFSKDSFHQLFGFGSKLLVSGLLNTIYVNLAPLAIGKFYSPAQLGNYNNGNKIASLPVSNIQGVLETVSFPVMAKIQDEKERLVHYYRKSIAMSSLLIFFLCVLIAAIAKPLIILMLSEKWANCVIYCQISAFAVMFTHVSSLNLSLLKVTGRSDLFLRLEIIKKAISVTILFIAIPFGVVAICFSSVIYTQIAIYINTFYTGKLYGLGYKKQIFDFGQYLILSVIVCIPSYLLCEFSGLPWWITLPIGITFPSFLYYYILRKDGNMLQLKGLLFEKVLKRWA